ncbi:hypothetical protein EDEG_01430 [Edhazardia aedis USNM 41457]|uniref:Uncharacterized protein n=1 Tax=Edhazardia aedis (strain USNM 41457) TaxID=1003232 RepID=J9D954_EDHAE|nr:hypothetical protein EDEG_01430 [Edhazardia aedis USNM 41457]|eukprot:EJW04306.1 hypothetical protein EDEG_01430 [Edhazardia aedis USNM 41457]
MSIQKKLDLKYQETIKNTILNEYTEQINQFRPDTGHVLLVSPDTLLLNYFLNTIKQTTFFKFRKIINVNSLLDDVDEFAVYLYDMDKKNTDQQKILYFLIENSCDCFVILYSCRVDCLDNMEKRVRSRFIGDIVYLKYFSKALYEHIFCLMAEYFDTLKDKKLSNTQNHYLPCSGLDELNDQSYKNISFTNSSFVKKSDNSIFIKESEISKTTQNFNLETKDFSKEANLLKNKKN